MDDADGGLRGLRAVPSMALVSVLTARYGLDARAAYDLGGGLNLNLLVAQGPQRYVARVYRPHVTEERLADVQRVRSAVRAAGVPVARVLPTLDGHPFVRLDDRLVEVEQFVDHDGRMNTADRLRRGLPLLGRTHTVLRGMELSAAGRTPGFVNHIEPDRVLAGTAAGTARIRAFQPATPVERQLADDADRLAEQVAAGEAELTGLPPRQVVHGDFWDNNVGFRDERVVLVTDFDFMGERARIDDLALTLYFADAEFGFSGTRDRIAALRPLVDAYAGELDEPLSAAEKAALPWALARQPLWGIGSWVARLDDVAEARRHANDTANDVRRALDVVSGIAHWIQAFA